MRAEAAAGLRRYLEVDDHGIVVPEGCRRRVTFSVVVNAVRPQDVSTAVVYGMPGVVAKAGVVDEMGPVVALARRVVDASLRREGGGQ